LHFITQNGNNATQRFAPVALMLEKLRVKQAIIEAKWQFQTRAVSRTYRCWTFASTAQAHACAGSATA